MLAYPHVSFGYSPMPLLSFPLAKFQCRRASSTSRLAHPPDSWMNFERPIYSTFPLQAITGKPESGIKLMIHSITAAAGRSISRFSLRKKNI
jgi:hypothetical protein